MPTQPPASQKRLPRYQDSSDSTVGHSSHQASCAAPAMASPAARKHSRLRTPNAANSGQAHAPWPANGWP